MEFGNGTHLLHDGEHPWLTVIVAVGTNSEVDLAGIRVCLEGRGQLEDPAQVALARLSREDLRDAYESGGARGTSDHRSVEAVSTLTYPHPLIGGWAQYKQNSTRTSSNGFGHLRLEVVRDLS